MTPLALCLLSPPTVEAIPEAVNDISLPNRCLMIPRQEFAALTVGKVTQSDSWTYTFRYAGKIFLVTRYQKGPRGAVVTSARCFAPGD